MALLGVAAGAMFIGALLLLALWSRYDFKAGAPKAMITIATPVYA